MDINQIPLPNQQPSAFDLSKYPVEILQSHVVSDLVNQNEDLMARLSINLKRNAEMESRLLVEAQKLKESSHKCSLLNDQILILKEKGRNQVVKHDDYLRRICELEQKNQDLNQISHRTQTALENQIQALQSSEQNFRNLLSSAEEDYARRISLLERYRRRILKWIAPHMIQLKSQLLELVDDTEQLKGDWYFQRVFLEKKLTRYASYRRRVKNHIHPKIKSAYENFNSLQGEHEILLQNHFALKAKQEGLIKLVDELNQKSIELQTQIDGYRVKISSQEVEINRLNNLVTHQKSIIDEQELKMVGLENKVIESHRRYTERTEVTQNEVWDLQGKLSLLRKEISEKDVLIDNQAQRQEALQNLHAESKNINDRLESENLSLRALWNDHRQKAEELKIQENSLKALNQELMAKLKDERQLNDNLKAQISLIESSYEKRLTELSQQIEMLNSKSFISDESARQQPTMSTEQMERFAKMDELIAEIQTGFASQKRKPMDN